MELTTLVQSRTLVNKKGDKLTLALHVDRLEQLIVKADGTQGESFTMDGDPLPKLRDTMETLFTGYSGPLTWKHDPTQDIDNLSEIESELPKAAARYQGSLKKVDTDFFADVEFLTLYDAAKFVDQWEMEFVTTFRRGDGIQLDCPFLKRVVIQFPMGYWWGKVVENNDD